MSFLLDTDICSAYLKGDTRIFNRFIQHDGRLHLSAVSLSELCSWAKRAAAPPSRWQVLKDMLAGVEILAADEAVGRRCGEIRAALLDQGRPAATVDLLIAATALIHDLTMGDAQHKPLCCRARTET